MPKSILLCTFIAMAKLLDNLVPILSLGQRLQLQPEVDYIIL